MSKTRALSRHERYTLIGIGLFIAALVLIMALWPTKKPEGKLTSVNLDVPVVMHTSGGRLEVATVTAKEGFKFEAPSRSFLGVDLGRTVSQLQVDVTYRFHINMAKQWPVRFQGHVAVVEASEVEPTIPVAFDTKTMQVETASGWARFDKAENLLELQRRLSPELERRSRGYKSSIVPPAARKTVAEFARTWLSLHPQWKSLGITEVKVILPGDPPATGTTLQPSLADQ